MRIFITVSFLKGLLMGLNNTHVSVIVKVIYESSGADSYHVTFGYIFPMFIVFMNT